MEESVHHPPVSPEVEDRGGNGGVGGRGDRGTFDKVRLGEGGVAEGAGSVDPDRKAVGGEEVGELFEFGAEVGGEDVGECFVGSLINDKETGSSKDLL